MSFKTFGRFVFFNGLGVFLPLELLQHWHVGFWYALSAVTLANLFGHIEGFTKASD